MLDNQDIASATTLLGAVNCRASLFVCVRKFREVVTYKSMTRGKIFSLSAIKSLTGVSVAWEKQSTLPSSVAMYATQRIASISNAVNDDRSILLRALVLPGALDVCIGSNQGCFFAIIGNTSLSNPLHNKRNIFIYS